VWRQEGKGCWGRKYRKSKEILQGQGVRAKVILVGLFVRQGCVRQGLNWVMMRR
jgi:hypothetical protein